MGIQEWLKLGVSGLLILATAFFVASEYSLVGSRRSRIEALAKRGNSKAVGLLSVLDNISPYIAGTQIAITMLGILLGSVAEPFFTDLIAGVFGRLDHRVAQAIGFLAVAFGAVVLGELVPKYWALQASDRVAMRTYRSLGLVVLVLRPIIKLAQGMTSLILRALGVHTPTATAFQRDELVLLVEAGEQEGTLDKSHADIVTRALRMDKLCARDIMIHRLDMKWLDVSLDRDAVMAKLKSIPYTRLPVCRGDIDDVVGIVYLHDVVRYWDEPDFSIERIARPIVAVPESLPFDRIVQTMREQKMQIVIVMDEYGGTSGLVTLEDVVEEVFGELEDRLESERSVIEIHRGGRISARAEVRFDELLARLDLDSELEGTTDTLATMIVDALERVPKMGDSIDTPLGAMRIENMARRRVTRLSIQLKPEFASRVQPSL